MITGNLGFVGAGQMATALAQGLVKAAIVTADRVLACDPSPAAREAFKQQIAGAQTVDSCEQLADRSEVLVLAVKPQQAGAATEPLRGHVTDKLVISVMAGVTIQELAAQLDSQRIVRVMPNTPCLIGCGAAGYARGPGVSLQDAALVQAMINAVGIGFAVPEPLLDAVTGLSGSGPGFVAVFIEALSDGGVRSGLPRDVALQLAAQTVRGAAELVLRGERHPAVLKDQVASPGGTTIAGIDALEQRGFRAAVIAAVTAATQRARELGRG
jgi:pyrroline-5-carboxylate reductase